MHNPRLLVAAGVVLVAVAVGAVLVASSGGDPEVADREPATTATVAPPVVRATLTLEQAEQPDTGVRELLVSLPGPQLNRAELAGAEQQVLLRCFDRRGAQVISEPVGWPLPEEAGFAPHIHRPSAPRLLDTIRRCRLTGPSIDFEGRVPGVLPEFG